MKQQSFTGKKKDGVLLYWRQQEYNEYVNSIPDGQEVTVTYKRYIVKRTLPQNALIHVYFDEIAKNVGKSKDWVKDEMKKMFLTVPAVNDYGEMIVNPKTGEVMTEVRDTSDLNKVEMMEFTEQVRMFVMDFGIYLEKAEEQVELKFKGLE